MNTSIEFLIFFYFFASFIVMFLSVLGYYRMMSKMERAERIITAIVNATLLHLEKEGIMRAENDTNQEGRNM